MVTEIKWAKSAKKDVRKIYKFYVKIANKEVADRIIDQIFPIIKTLVTQKNIGQKEERLAHFKMNHRYLISRHNKIVYIQKEDAIYITHVFDTRQNPSKLK